MEGVGTSINTSNTVSDSCEVRGNGLISKALGRAQSNV